MPVQDGDAIAMAAAQGERIAGFILITGLVHDADECQDETMVHLHGGVIIRVPCTLDEVLAWFA